MFSNEMNSACLGAFGLLVDVNGIVAGRSVSVEIDGTDTGCTESGNTMLWGCPS